MSKAEELVGRLSAGDRAACWALARWSINRWSIDVALLKSLVPCCWRVTGVVLLGALAGRCCFLKSFGVRSRKKLPLRNHSSAAVAHAGLQATDTSFPAAARRASTPYLRTASSGAGAKLITYSCWRGQRQHPAYQRCAATIR
jgi:hypothetical protein